MAITNPTTNGLLAREEVLDPIVSKNANTVLEKRYYKKDESGVVVEDAMDMYLRVANHIASAEPIDCKMFAHSFYDIMATNTFMPNSPCLMNAAKGTGMLSACFVLPVEDDLPSIMKTNSDIAIIQKAGGGTGMSFSRLRPSESIVSSSGGTSSGPIPFISMMSSTTQAIQQGSFRRGANMGILRIDHPDIIKFIETKEDLTKWQNYNVSISIPDKWMRNLDNDPNKQHEISHDKWGNGFLWRNIDTKEIKAFKKNEQPDGLNDRYVTWSIKDTWDLICQRAHTTGEPGLFFVDKANEDNVTKHLGLYEATNPCGEQPLYPYDCCNLGSINLTKFYDNSIKGRFYWSKFKDAIHTSVRFLDNCITVNKYPILEMKKMAEDIRRIGLGVMGFADLLFMMRIPYDSKEGRQLGKHMSQFLAEESERMSEILAVEKGTFLEFRNSDLTVPVRNAYTTTVAPTGTISIIANCSGGIEPIFALAFRREVMGDSDGKMTIMWEVNPHFEDAVASRFSGKLEKSIIEYAKQYGSLKDYDLGQKDDFAIANSSIGIRLAELQKVFVTAQDISPEAHVHMQAAWQEYIDSAISKTVNMPRNAKIEDVDKIYRLAFDTRCKGVTVYRDGCRDGVEGMKQPMAVKPKTTTIDKEVFELIDGNKAEVKDIEALIPEKTEKIQESTKAIAKSIFKPAIKFEYKTQFGTMHVNVVLDGNNQPMEVFAQIGKSADMVFADLEAMCRLISIMLQAGIPLQTATAQMYGIGSSQVGMGPTGKVYSLPDALAKALIFWIENNDTPQVKNSSSNASDRFDSDYGIPCPSCNVGKLTFSEGCKKCMSCGYSAC